MTITAGQQSLEPVTIRTGWVK